MFRGLYKFPAGMEMLHFNGKMSGNSLDACNDGSAIADNGFVDDTNVSAVISNW